MLSTEQFRQFRRSWQFPSSFRGRERLGRRFLQRPRCDVRAAQQLHDAVKETRPCFVAFVSPRNVAHEHVDAESRRPNADRRNWSKGTSHVARHDSLPFLLGQAHVGLSGNESCLATWDVPLLQFRRSAFGLRLSASTCSCATLRGLTNATKHGRVSFTASWSCCAARTSQRGRWRNRRPSLSLPRHELANCQGRRNCRNCSVESILLFRRFLAILAIS